MFTGIVEETGKIARLEKGAAGARIEVEAAKVLEGTRLGDSICVNGVCLTVAAMGARSFRADIMNETLERSSFRSCKPGDIVDLERALTPTSRMGGHIMTGHIDGLGRIERVQRDGQAVWFAISCAAGLLRYIVEKGSVALDGMSLTVARVDGSGFAVSCIPHTLEVTVLRQRRAGDMVNIECDVLAKYVEKLLAAGHAESAGRADSGAGEGEGGARADGADADNASGSAGKGGLDAAFLAEHGFL